MRGVWKRSHGRATKAPPDERGGNRHARPNAAAPHLDSTETRQSRITCRRLPRTSPKWRRPVRPSRCASRISISIEQFAHFLARPKGGHVLFGHPDVVARTRVAPRARSALLGRENSEPA